MPQAFHLFTQLPAELRIKVWTYAVFPRMVRIEPLTRQNLRMIFESPSSLPPRSRAARRKAKITATNAVKEHSIQGVKSSSATPVLMRTCRESRSLGLYQKAFPVSIPGEGHQRYVWINFETDMIDYPLQEFHHLDQHYDDIKRLRFQPEKDERAVEALVSLSSDNFTCFSSLEELHILTTGCPLIWAEMASFSPCPWSGVRYIDRTTGMMFTPGDLHVAQYFWAGPLQDWEMENYLNDREEDNGTREPWAVTFEENTSQNQYIAYF